MFGDFILLAADQLVNHAAKYPTIYGVAVAVPLVVRTPMGGGRGYGPTHSQSLEKLFLGVPGLTVLAPSHFHDVGALLEAAATFSRPVLFIENKLLYSQRLKLDGVPGSLRREVRQDAAGWPHVLLYNYDPSLQPDVTIITYGGISRLLEPVLAQCREEEIWVQVCLCGSLNPVPVELIVECSQHSGRVLIVEEGSAEFGWGAGVASRIYEGLHGQLLTPITCLGAAASVIPASKPLEEELLVSSAKMMQAVLKLLS
jgi:pyruvate/2-oxoglutarate/acetoin dehydrogenase E1 component